jgi:hypothetical protein
MLFKDVVEVWNRKSVSIALFQFVHTEANL